MVSCVHHVPGRARFKLDALRRDPDLAERIHAEVSRLPGISGVEVNRHAASVIVHYCTERGDLSLVMDHICVHCPKSAAARRAGALAPIPEPAAGRPIRGLA